MSILLLLACGPVDLPAQSGWTSTTIDAGMYDVSLLDSLSGVAVGAGGTILRTSNGGIDWLLQSSPVSTFLNGVHFVDATHVTAVGDSGTILSSINGGISWVQRPCPVGTLLSAVCFADSNTGMVVGYQGTILRTTDGGSVWTSVWPGVSEYFYGVVLTGPDTAVVVGIPYAAGPQFLLRTTTGGTTWDTLDTGVHYPPLGAVSASPNGTIVAVGQDGVIMRSTDDGRTWGIQASNTTESLLGVTMVDDVVGTAVGTNETIIRTTDGGTSWVTQLSRQGGLALGGVSFADAQMGIAVGTNVINTEGIILRTTAGGTEVGEEGILLPLTWNLCQNYPNPFNPSTTIDYALPRSAHVMLEVFNILGERVSVLSDGIQEAGYHSMVLEAEGLPSGIYLYRIRAGDFVKTRRMILVK